MYSCMRTSVHSSETRSHYSLGNNRLISLFFAFFGFYCMLLNFLGGLVLLRDRRQRFRRLPFFLIETRNRNKKKKNLVVFRLQALYKEARKWDGEKKNTSMELYNFEFHVLTVFSEFYFTRHRVTVT